jgi:SAM-dependent methyltransferase
VKPPRRSAFDVIPEIYDRARPEYPPQLFDDLLAYLGSSGAPDVLEIGPGTGQATRSLLARGARVTAVELGPNLASFLAAKFEAEDRLQVVWDAFEDAQLESNRYDLVLAATSFHWIDPAVRLSKSHGILRPGGVLAVIETNQVRSAADRGFFDRCFPIYRRHRPGERRTKSPGEDLIPPAFAELQGSHLFDDAHFWRYRWDQTYTTAAYADLVLSYSNTQDMEPGPRAALVADLCALVDAEFNGYVVRPLVITLAACRRKTPSPAHGSRGGG